MLVTDDVHRQQPLGLDAVAGLQYPYPESFVVLIAVEPLERLADGGIHTRVRVTFRCANRIPLTCNIDVPGAHCHLLVTAR